MAKWWPKQRRIVRQEASQETSGVGLKAESGGAHHSASQSHEICASVTNQTQNRHSSMPKHNAAVQFHWLCAVAPRTLTPIHACFGKAKGRNGFRFRFRVEHSVGSTRTQESAHSSVPPWPRLSLLFFSLVFSKEGGWMVSRRSCLVQVSFPVPLCHPLWFLAAVLPVFSLFESLLLNTEFTKQDV